MYIPVHTQEALSKYQEALCHCAGGRAVAQATQRLWAVLLGHLQKLPGRGPVHPALWEGPACAVQPQPFCGPANHD